ncbi:MAG: hypothetical protein IKG11_05570 [Atopobiaceae bacterium]|nr:hypothetical protein [Atopobiaceae bacterium]
MTKPNFKPLILAVLAAIAIAVGLALEPRMARAEGGTDMDDAIALEVDETQEFTSSGEQVYVWFTFTTGVSGEYSLVLANKGGAVAYHPRLSLFDANGNDLGASCAQDRTEFYADANATFYLCVYDDNVRITKAGSKGYAVTLTREGGSAQIMSFNKSALNNDDLLWLGCYDGTPIAWVIVGDNEERGRNSIPIDGATLYAYHVLWRGLYHLYDNYYENLSLTTETTDLYCSTEKYYGFFDMLPTFKASSFSASEQALIAKDSLGIVDNDLGVCFFPNGEEGKYWYGGIFEKDGAWCAYFYADNGLGEESNYSTLSGINGICPTFTLNTESVLLWSAAVGGKPTSETGTLAPFAEGSGGYKLTLLDGDRGFAASANTETVTSGGTIEISYEGARTGENEYVSAILVRSLYGEYDVKPYYGHMAVDSESGTAVLTLPTGMKLEPYTLYVFSEQCNGDCRTDYASAFVEIPLTVTGEVPGGSQPGDVPGGDQGGTPAQPAQQQNTPEPKDAAQSVTPAQNQATSSAPTQNRSAIPAMSDANASLVPTMACLAAVGTALLMPCIRRRARQ